MLGEPEALHLLASDAGYGFVARFEDLCARNRNGKAVLNVPSGGRALAPAPVPDSKADRIAAVTSSGRLLLTAAAGLPVLGKGKGLKIINIPSAKFKAGEERLAAITVLGPKDSLVLYAGKRHLTLKPGDLEHYAGERGRRGNLLPRGFRQVIRLAPLAPG
jgi:topoisomerase-4 subunit A